MRGVYDVDEVRVAEQRAFERVGPEVLMARAATALARTCVTVLNQSGSLVYGARVVLLVGTGNNGGDALFAGVNLARRGAQVTAVRVEDRAHRQGLAALQESGARVVDSRDLDVASLVDSADLIIDGMLGIGGRGGLRGQAAELAELAIASDAIVVSADLPSGLDADTGVIAGSAVWADVTVTFGALKPGLLLPPGADHVGLLDVADIGLDEDLAAPTLGMLEVHDAASRQPRPLTADHKYSQGVIGVAAGSDRYPGAAVLTVGAALLTKPGLVRYTGAAATHVVSAWPSAIVSRDAPEAIGRVQAWAVGPGLGTDDTARRILTGVLDQGLPTVIDADALTLVAASPGMLHDRVAITVVTPHEREFARLAPDLDLAPDRVAAVRALAARLGCTVLLKGATTVVADPDGQARLVLTGTPWLATGGTGDVLTGMIGAYLAAGSSPLEASADAAFVHGLAGRSAANEAPCTAYDVVTQIPAAIRTLTDP